MDSRDVNVPPSFRSTDFNIKSTFQPCYSFNYMKKETVWSFEKMLTKFYSSLYFIDENTNRLTGRKRKRRVIQLNENVPGSPLVFEQQQTAVQNSPPFVIDLTNDIESQIQRTPITSTSNINQNARHYSTANNSLILSIEQDQLQFQQDRELAQRLQQQEYSIQNARSSHSNFPPRSNYFNSYIPNLNINSHSHHHHHRREFDFGVNRAYQPPWSNANANNIFPLFRYAFLIFLFQIYDKLIYFLVENLLKMITNF